MIYHAMLIKQVMRVQGFIDKLQFYLQVQGFKLQALENIPLFIPNLKWKRAIILHLEITFGSQTLWVKIWFFLSFEPVLEDHTPQWDSFRKREENFKKKDKK